MWTGLGVIFIIVALGGSALMWIIRMIFLTFQASGERDEIREKVDKANEQKRKSIGYDRGGAMLETYRYKALKEDPKELLVNPKISVNKVNPYSNEFAKSIELRWQEGFYKRAEGGKATNQDIATLVYQYICTSGYSEFGTAFTMLLINDKRLLLDFIRECYAAEKWKKENHQLYDCNNYLQSFMIENHIQERLDKMVGHTVYMPTDFRHFRPDNQDPDVVKYIKREKERNNQIGKSEEKEMTKNTLIGVIGFVMLIGLILIIGWVTTGFSSGWGAMLGICFVVWFVLAGIACFVDESQNSIDSRKSSDVWFHNNPTYEIGRKMGEQFVPIDYNKGKEIN